MKRTLPLFAMLALLPMAGALSAEGAGVDVEALLPTEAVPRDEALQAWDRIYQVAAHPRCANCHVGEDNLPMWSGPSYGEPRPHGMFISGGESRIGAEFVLCSTCHTTREDGRRNDGPHQAPQVAMDWRLAPVEAAWFGRESTEICQQLRDPDRNGGRGFMDLAAHLDHDVILHWAWSPGGGREPAPYSLVEHIQDVLLWGVGGQPCPDDAPDMLWSADQGALVPANAAPANADAETAP